MVAVNAATREVTVLEIKSLRPGHQDLLEFTDS
jgi:hypothetical protein